MIVLIGCIEIRLPYAHSLKEKRKTAKSLTARLYQRHNASVREIASQNLHQMLVLGLSYTALSETEAQHAAHEMEKTIWRTIESEGELLKFETELLLPGFSEDY